MGLLNFLKEQLEVIRKKDPSVKSASEVILYPGVKALFYYKLSHELYKRKHFFLSRYLSQRAARKTGIEIHPGASIGKGFFIDHGIGTIIGETAEIGENVTIYQGVTLGANSNMNGKRHPTIYDNVIIYSGAKIIGNICVGRNSVIGAGAVVVKSIPENCIAVGVPAKIIRRS